MDVILSEVHEPTTSKSTTGTKTKATKSPSKIKKGGRRRSNIQKRRVSGTSKTSSKDKATSSAAAVAESTYHDANVNGMEIAQSGNHDDFNMDQTLSTGTIASSISAPVLPTSRSDWIVGGGVSSTLMYNHHNSTSAKRRKVGASSFTTSAMYSQPSMNQYDDGMMTNTTFDNWEGCQQSQVNMFENFPLSPLHLQGGLKVNPNRQPSA